MSAKTSTALSRYDCSEHSTDETIAALVETVQQQQETIDELTATVDEQQTEIDELRDDVDDQAEVDVDDESDPLGSLTVDGLPLGSVVRSKVTETDVETIIDEYEPRGDGDDGSNPTPNGSESRVQTPLERVCSLPEASVETNLTRNQQRARFVATGITDYGRRVPAGVAIRSSEIRRVLSASESSSIHTQTVARVMDFLDDLGGDDVSIKTTRSGERAVVFSEEIVGRITSVVTDERDGTVIEATI